MILWKDIVCFDNEFAETLSRFRINFIENMYAPSELSVMSSIPKSVSSSVTLTRTGFFVAAGRFLAGSVFLGGEIAMNFLALLDKYDQMVKYDMFIDCKYTNWYFNIINRSFARSIDLFEKHHVIPKSLGGSNASNNIAKLTPREHLVCHALLTKMTVGQANYKMLCALNMMMHAHSKNHSRVNSINSRVYQKLRENFLAACKGVPKPVGFGEKVAASNRTRTVSEKVKSRLKEYNSRRVFTPQLREKLSAAAPKTKTDDHKQKISKALTGKTRSKEHSENIAKALKARHLREKSNKSDHNL